MEALKARRQIIKGGISRIHNACMHREAALHDVKVRVEKLDDLFSQYEGIQDEIDLLTESAELKSVEEAYRLEIETKYFAVKSSYSSLLQSECSDQTIIENDSANMSQTIQAIANTQTSMSSILERMTTEQLRQSTPIVHPTTSHTAQPDTRLPQIQIPDFDGAYTEWIRFRDLFEALIHNRNAISKVEKLEYLQTRLKGEALSLVRHLKPTNDNYEIAWKILNDKYDKSEHVKRAYFEQLFDQPAIRTSSISEIKRLHSNFNESLNALKVLNEPIQHWDSVLLFLLEKKLDAENQVLWCRDRKSIKGVKFQNFLTFLEDRVFELESIQQSSSRPTTVARVITNRGRPNAYSATIQNCVCCDGNHFLFQCDEFKALSVQDRFQLVRRHNLCLNCLRPNHFAASCKASSCKLCNARHNTILHFPSDLQMHQNVATLEQNQTTQSFTVNTTNRISASSTILPTLIVMVRDQYNQLKPCRALLDSGAQATLISESCVQYLGLKRQRDKTLMVGVGLNPGNYTRGRVDVEIVSQRHQRSFFTVAYCLSKLTQNLPSHDIDSTKFEFFRHLRLADEQFNKSAKIDIIMGADLFSECMLPDRIVHPTGSPAAINTLFGWVVMGRVPNQQEPGIFSAHVTLDLDRQLQRFWEIEDVPQTGKIMSEEEKQAETHYLENYQKLDNGRYMVKLPFKKDGYNLGESKTSALKRFRYLERKFDLNSKLKEEYTHFLQEYIDLNHMEVDRSADNIQGYFLPHHAILKPGSSTTKLRVVFDGSCRTSSGVSLNERLLVGPTIQNDLLTIILNFRKYEIGMSADVEKMYRQVIVHPDDRRFQRILWRKSKNEPIAEYHLNTITYGTSAAPFLAIRTLHQIAIDNSEKHSEAAQALDEHFYVDDFMCSSKNVNSAMQLKSSLCSVLSQAGFNLRKWASNSTDFKESINVSERNSSAETVIDSSQDVKTLGLWWDTRTDNFKYATVIPPLPDIVTKRLVLSDIAKIFDPAGWVAPIIIALKVFMQKLWLRGIGWDQPLPDDLLRQWNILRDGIRNVSRIKIQRWLGIEDEVKIELHGFADSSEVAYAAVIYLRVVRLDGTEFVNLITSKSRVSPVKQVTLPRLELCAAHLLAKLMTSVQISMNLQNCDVVAWSDSTVMLAWLSDHPRRWKSFVANRTSYILERIPSHCWRHITSNNNPADLATRGISPSELLNNQLWWHGPDKLKSLNTITKGTLSVSSDVDMEEKRDMALHVAFKGNQSIIETFSNYNKLIRITTLIQRFHRNCMTPRNERSTGFLTSSELQVSEYTLLRIAQEESYKSERRILQDGKQLAGTNKLSQLAPFVDKKGLMRVGGRIENANISYDQKHPVILHKDHPLTNLIVQHYHSKYLHAGHRQLMYLIGLRYWITSVSCVVKRCIYKCTTCMRFRGIPFTQQMGNLPAHRLQQNSPFINTGVDFAGPIQVRSWKGRGSKLYKAWIAVFVCLTTKAMHLELVTELSTAAFVAALRRFVSRRGKPLHIYSDNGTNFVGCNQHLRDLHQHLQNNKTQLELQTAMSEQEIQWHFSPPSAPHFGGIWEAGVKSVKYHLKRLLADAHVTFEEMSTVLCQIESCLNSRPLCKKFQGDVDPLTPAHFLIMRSMAAVPDENLSDTKVNYCNRWKYLQKLVQEFWKKWSKEYLSQLQQRHKWRERMQNVNIDDIVIIKDENLPPTKWSIARIVETHPGSDGLIRVVTLKTVRGLYKRPLSKICPLFLDI